MSQLVKLQLVSRPKCWIQSVLGTLALFMLLVSPAHAGSQTSNGITFTDTSLVQAQRGVVYETDPGSTTDLNTRVSGGTQPYSYAITAGALPTGLRLSSTGQLTGVNCTSSNGTFPFSVAITDAAGTTGDFDLSINMTAGPGGACDLTLTPGDLTASTPVSQSYTTNITATGGTGPYTFTVVSGSLPPGLSLAADGTISGTPNVSGTYSFSVRANDSTGLTGYQYSAITVTSSDIVIGPASLPNGTNGTPYNEPLTQSGGTGPYTCTATGGALPPGLSLSASGITGTPTSAGSYSFQVTCTDSLGGAATKDYTLVIDPGAVLTLAPANLPAGINGTAYSQTLSATGGTGTGYAFTLDSGSLPSPLTLSASGVISGTPDTAGTYTFTVRVVDSAGNYQTREYTITVDPGAVLTLAPASLPNATNGTAYNQSLTALGGTGTGYVFTRTTGALPSGLALGTNGVISGTPTTPGVYTFTVQVVDSADNYQSRSYTITVDPGAVLVLGPATLANPTQGIGYSASVVATGGSGIGYAYTISSGALPSGLSLNPATGAITGRTLASGTFTFTVRAVDSQGNWGTRTYTFTIVERPDPTRDTEVIALSDGQFRTVSRFAEGQATNTMRHMESLHGGLRCGIQNDLRVTAANPAHGNVDQSGNGAARQNPVAVSCDQDQLVVSLWAAGSIGRDNDDLNLFKADAVTFGLDIQLAKRVIVGGAFGYGWGDSRLGTRGSKTDDHAKTGMIYGSFGLNQKVFLDVVAGKSWTNHKGTRYITPDSGTATFNRDGSVTFGSAAVTFEQPIGRFLVAGNMRYDYLNIKLDGYQEVTSSAYGLTMQESDQQVQVFSLGIRGETTFEYSWGKFIPGARLEMRFRVAGDYDQVMAYSDLLTRQYTLQRPSNSTSSMALSGGGRFQLGDTELGVEYGTSGTALESFSGSELRITLRQKF